MALQPNLSPLLLGSVSAPHTLEFYIDYVCPFSAKIMFNAVDPVIKPLITEGGKYEGKVKVILRLQPQPFHASSMLLHEAALAVMRASPKNFYAYHLLLYKNQSDFFDQPASKLTPVQIRAQLVSLSSEVIGQESAKEAAELLRHKTTPNGGTAVTDDLKYNIKIGRQNGINVTPTALWDGLIQGDISSSWGEKEWTKFFEDKVTA